MLKKLYFNYFSQICYKKLMLIITNNRYLITQKLLFSKLY